MKNRSGCSKADPQTNVFGSRLVGIVVAPLRWECSAIVERMRSTECLSSFFCSRR